MVIHDIPPNSVVVGIPGKVVFRVEGERRIALDQEFMPDPQGRAITSLLERVSRLEERLNRTDPDARSEKAMYEERTYRRVSRPRDLVCYEVACKETDLFCCTSVGPEAFIEERALFYRNQLETYIRGRPEFLESLRPIAADTLAPKIVKEMVEASADLGVGPMACVAGAVAEFIGARHRSSSRMSI